MVAQVSLYALLSLLLASGMGAGLIATGLLMWFCLVLGLAVLWMLPLQPDWKEKLLNGFINGPGLRGGCFGFFMCFLGFWIQAVLLMIVLACIGWNEFSTAVINHWGVLVLAFTLGLVFGGVFSAPFALPRRQ